MKFKSAYLISIQAILFVIFLLVTFFFNRFANDDYQLIGILRESSFQDIYSRLYFEWHGRWTSNFFLVTLIQLNKIPFFLLAYNILSVGLLYLGIFRLSKSISAFYQLNLKKKTLLIYSIVFLSILFFCTISANDIWLWYTSSVVYLWSTIAFFFGINLFVSRQRGFLDYIIFGISVIYIGGSNEPLTFFSVLILLFLILKKKETFISGLGIVLICGAFLINYLSPGTLHRDEITPSLSFIDLLLYSSYGSVKFLLFSIHKTFIPALLLGIPFYLLGKKSTSSISKNFKPTQQLIQSIILVLVAVIINQLIVVYALGGLAPDRSTTVSTIFISILLVLYLFLLGNHHQAKYQGVKYVIALNLIGLICFNVYYANIHYNYANAVDERIEFIKENDQHLIVVKPLPKSGYIYSSEITTASTNFKNQHLKNGLEIKNDVVLENTLENLNN